MNSSETLDLTQVEIWNETIDNCIATKKYKNAEDLLLKCLFLTPNWTEGYSKLGYIYYALGSKLLSIIQFEKCISIYPYHLSAYENVIKIKLELNLFDEALKYSLLLEDYLPGISENQSRIGTFYLRIGFYSKAKFWLDKGLNSLLRQVNTRILPYGVVTIPRLLHDVSQIQYLISQKILSNDYVETINAYNKIILASPYAKNPESWHVEHEWSLDQFSLSSICPFYRRVLFLAEADSLPQSTLNSRINFSHIEKQYMHCKNGINYVVVDDLLSEQALLNIQTYCLNSTIWHNDGQKGRNYLGAYQDNGFQNPLLSQVVEELQQAMPNLLGSRQLSQLWAYRNVTGISGIGTHADFAEVNVNIWITPNKANKKKAGGGLKIYYKSAPSNWKFEDYNDNDDLIQKEIDNVDYINIPYMENRAIIFNSSLFHETDKISFGANFEDRRINITLLFGNRELADFS